MTFFGLFKTQGVGKPTGRMMKCIRRRFRRSPSPLIPVSVPPWRGELGLLVWVCPLVLGILGFQVSSFGVMVGAMSMVLVEIMVS